MQQPNHPLRRLAGLLACVLVLFGTTGAAALDAVAHAGPEHSHHESRGGPESQGPECVLCVAAAAAAIVSVTVPGMPAALPACPGDVASPASRALHATTYYLTPPGRGPPTV
jgi:hypothetical protein